jgi:hypothetical protein
MQSLVLKCLKGRPATLCNWRGPIRSEERIARNATTKIVYHENWVQGLRMEEPEFWKDKKVEIWNYEHSSLRRRDPKLCLTQRERIKESKGTMKNLPVDKWVSVQGKDFNSWNRYPRVDGSLAWQALPTGITNRSWWVSNPVA